MGKYKRVLIGSTILLLILSPRFVVKAEEINSNTVVDMANQGKSDFLMVDGFLSIYTKNNWGKIIEGNLTWKERNR